MTIDCRILRYYVSQDKPNFMLVLLTEFCIKVYFPNFFEVEAKSSIADGPKILFSKLSRVTQFPDKQVRDTAIKVLRRKGLFCSSWACNYCDAWRWKQTGQRYCCRMLIRLCLYVKHSLLATLTTFKNKQRESKSCEEVQGSIHEQKMQFRITSLLSHA